MVASFDKIPASMKSQNATRPSRGEGTGSLAAPAACRYERSPNGTASHALLLDLIEGEIIPRLFLAHSHAPARGTSGTDTGETEVFEGDEAFARLFLDDEPSAIVKHLQIFIDDGVPRSRIYVEMLSPVPRTLGMFWEQGRCSFEDFAKGLARVDYVVQALRPNGAAGGEPH